MRVQLLDADPELGRYLARPDFDRMRRAITVPTLSVNPGEWRPARSEPESGHLGYLLLDGLMIRQVEIAGGGSIELLSLGHLLRPWLEDAASFVAARWRVVEPIRLAILDPPTAALLCRSPQVMSELLDRGLRRSRSLAVSAALEHIRGIDRRLWVLLWHLAEGSGRREPDGSVLVPLRLTHETLAILVGARRPTVTTALATLRQRELAEQVPRRGWRLYGKAPEPGPVE